MKIGEKIVRIESCSSTNDLANVLAMQGEKEGTVIIAEEQTAGRGTKGRKWHSARQKGIYLSVILRPQRRDMSLLPLAAGLAVRDALFEVEDIQVRLKWPNDLICKRKKLGGILCEASFVGNEMSHVILGIGINLSQEREDFPEEFRSQAISMKLLLRKEIDKEMLLCKLWEILDDWYNFFLQGKDVQIVRVFEENSVFSSGEKLTVETEKERIKGEYRGLDLQGRLLLASGKKERAFLAAEVLEIKRGAKED